MTERDMSGKNNPNWKGGRDKQILVRLTPRAYKMLEDLAKLEECSKNELIHRLITKTWLET